MIDNSKNLFGTMDSSYSLEKYYGVY